MFEKIIMGTIIVIVVIPAIIGIFLGLCDITKDRLRRTKDWQFVDNRGQVWIVKGQPLFCRSKKLKIVKPDDNNIKAIPRKS